MVHDGSWDVGDGFDGDTVASTELHMALAYAMILLPVVEPQAALEQSRMP